jgi:hypothetical protein
MRREEAKQFIGTIELRARGWTAARIAAGCAPIVLVRQVKPGTRARCGFYLNTNLIPVPDDEALIHAMFEIASRREPAPATMQSFCALRDKYATARGSC